MKYQCVEYSVIWSKTILQVARTAFLGDICGTSFIPSKEEDPMIPSFFRLLQTWYLDSKDSELMTLQKLVTNHSKWEVYPWLLTLRFTTSKILKRNMVSSLNLVLTVKSSCISIRSLAQLKSSSKNSMVSLHSSSMMLKLEKQL